MSTRSAGIRAWCGRVWRCVLHATQVIAGCDLSGQRTGGWPPQYVDVPVEWAQYALCAAPDAWWTLDPAARAQSMWWAHAPAAVTTAAPRRAAKERISALTPVEYARLRVIRDRHLEDHTRLTGRELAHLRFVRWLHQTGRIAA